jgi:hypothetical protein
MLAAAAFEASQLRAAEQGAVRYKFAEGMTNAYRVTVESPNRNSPMQVEGYVVVGVREVDEGVATVFFRARMQPKPVPGRQHMPFVGPHGPYGPRFEPWRFTNLGHGNETQIDSSGRILRTAGLQELPKPLESYVEFFFHQLPTDLSKPQQSEQRMTVDEDGSGRGRMPGAHYPGGPGAGPGRVAGVRKETIQVAEKSETTLKLQKTTEFQSYLKTDDEPRLAYSTKAELVFDTATGALKSAKIEGNSSTATPDVLQRSALNVRIERLEGAELAKAIAENADRPAILSEAELEKLVGELQQEDPQKRSEAAQRLLAADIDKHASKLLPKFKLLLHDEDHMVGMVAARVLARAATREDLPMLHRMLKQEDRGNHHEVIQALARLKDKTSIQPLADMIGYGSGNAYNAAEALGEFGPAAEEAALALLKEKHLETRRHACQILRKAGTSKSIEPLQAVIGAGDPQLIHDVTETMRSIRQRGEESE